MLESVELTSKTFIAERNISVFSKLDKLAGVTIRIGVTEEEQGVDDREWKAEKSN